MRTYLTLTSLQIADFIRNFSIYDFGFLSFIVSFIRDGVFDNASIYLSNHPVI
ncbi:hypothetical protein [Cohnella abietis]|uniref:hypothetical protein n=1 Tax=Cohnella abietis TaxID=2507935 RepID=UPI00138FD795|nr:hypothetical protein [Cohnella abietis]